MPRRGVCSDSVLIPIESWPMEGKRLLHYIRLENLLSYGSEGVGLDLEPLNILIGPNAAGKSNLIDAISLLAAAPRNILIPFREGGAYQDWLWKGSAELPAASIGVALDGPVSSRSKELLSYLLSFTVTDVRLLILREELEGGGRLSFYRDTLEVNLPAAVEVPSAFNPNARRPSLDHQQSLLSQVRDPVIYPELTHVSDQLGNIKFFRGWPLGRDNPLRKPQAVNLPDDFLLENGSNLGLVLNDLQNRLEIKRLLLEKLRLLYEEIEDVTTKTQGGTIQIFFHERGLKQPVPAARLSDGTLHYLCLLVVLLHPEPPPLICIEEPELGLHPDILPKVADLLLDAAHRTQLVVTTHSETIVSRLSEVPESIVICERDDHGTHLRRLEPNKLRAWLDKYMLGELWRMGEIGANRW